MIKQFVLKIEESELDSFRDYAEKNGMSVAELLRAGAKGVISGGAVVAPSVDAEELVRLRAQVSALVDENVSLRDTLEAASASGSASPVSHTTKFGRDVYNYGLPKELNQAVDNIILRLRSIPAGSAQRYARLINSWSSNAIRPSSGNYTPESTKAPKADSVS